MFQLGVNYLLAFTVRLCNESKEWLHQSNWVFGVSKDPFHKKHSEEKKSIERFLRNRPIVVTFHNFHNKCIVPLLNQIYHIFDPKWLEKAWKINLAENAFHTMGQKYVILTNNFFKFKLKIDVLWLI
jgi:hypothetical protein